MQPAERGNCRIYGVDRSCLVRHVGFDETGIGAEFLRQLFAGLTVQVGQNHLGTGFRQHPRGRRPEAGTGTGDQKNLALDFHPLSPESLFPCHPTHLRDRAKNRRQY